MWPAAFHQAFCIPLRPAMYRQECEHSSPARTEAESSAHPAAFATHRRAVRLLDELPELAISLDDEARCIASGQITALAYDLHPGWWDPRAVSLEADSGLGLLVTKGLLTRDVTVAGTRASELIGSGDLLRPLDYDWDEAPVPFLISWSVLEPARVIVLDARVANITAQWPDVYAGILRRGVKRAQTVAALLAVGHLTGVDVRLLVLFWSLADRFGHTTREGVIVPLRLTQEILGRLIGAKRPPVSHALKRLALERHLVRRPEGGWLLLGDPVEGIQRLRVRRLDERRG